MKRIFKNIRLSLAALTASFTVYTASAAWPVRFWDDDMPLHTFSLGWGPSFYSDSSPVLAGYEFPPQDVSPVGFAVTLRYDWSYFRGYEVSLAAGLTYILSHGSFAVNSGYVMKNSRVKETFNYVGANLLNTKMWFGKRTIWDVCIHMGYSGAVSRFTSDSHSSKTRENGFMGGVSTGVDVLVTAWLGVGLHGNIMTGVMSPSGESGSRQYTLGTVRLGAVYCF